MGILKGRHMLSIGIQRINTEKILVLLDRLNSCGWRQPLIGIGNGILAQLKIEEIRHRQGEQQGCHQRRQPPEALRYFYLRNKLFKPG